jgi:hypothetical protein
MRIEPLKRFNVKIFLLLVDGPLFIKYEYYKSTFSFSFDLYIFIYLFFLNLIYEKKKITHNRKDILHCSFYVHELFLITLYSKCKVYV